MEKALESVTKRTKHWNQERKGQSIGIRNERDKALESGKKKDKVLKSGTKWKKHWN